MKEESAKKYALLIEELKNPKLLAAKLMKVYCDEFEDQIPKILLQGESEFLNNFFRRCEMLLEDIYSSDSLENETLIRMKNLTEKKFYDDYYKKSLIMLNKAYSDYEKIINPVVPARKKAYDKFLNPAPVTKPTYFKNFRKHCSKTEAVGCHTCRGKFLPVTNERKEITFVICTGCKEVYTSSCIHMYCTACKLDYYSTYVSDAQSNTFQPATWEKYHCSALVNDQMRCIKCKDPFFLKMSTNTLFCKNCKFETNPNSVLWMCMVCKNDFKTNAKVYNPLEFRSIRNSIKEAILSRSVTRPVNVPCCDIDPADYEFFHKSDCRGTIYKTEINHKQVAVCGKCKTISSIEKFVWTCPVCLKRFRQKDVNIQQQDQQKRVNTESGQFATLDLVHTENSYLKTEISNTGRDNLDDESNSRSRGKSNSRIERRALNISLGVKKDAEEETSKIITPNRGTSKSNTVRDANVKQNKNYSIMNPVKRATINLDDEEPKKSDKYQIRSFSRNKTITDSDEETEEPSRYTKYMNSHPLKNTSYNKSISISENSNLPRFNSVLSGNGHITPRIGGDPKGEQTNEKDMRSSTSSGGEVLKGFYGTNQKKRSDNSPVRLLSSDKLQKIEVNSMVTEPEDSKKFDEENNDKNSKLKEFNFEEYNIVTQIGEGSFGKIYLVEDKNKNFFSMKKIIANDDIDLESFRQEYELVNSVRQKNILKILAICTRKLDLTTHVLYILMEVGLTDWEKEIKSRQAQKNYYSEDELKNILKQLVSALSFLQAHNISHRDIKPQNVLVFKDNVYKVADFGEAKQISKLETTKQLSTLRGTELYMSPLLFNALRTNQNDIKHNSFKSDVFSLGLCLLLAATLNINHVYECRNMYDNKTVNVFLNKALRGRYSQWFINMLAKMLEIHEVNRYDFNDLLEIVKDFD